MPKSFLSLLLLVYAAPVVFFVGCGCLDDEQDARDACRTITVSVNRVRSECSWPELEPFEVCGEVCAPSGCQDRLDVAECARAIERLSCDTIGLTSNYRDLAECRFVFEAMAESCSTSESDEDTADFDDDD